MYYFAVLFILVRVVCTQECSTCQCCADGYITKCFIGGYCINGCLDGYYGGKCENKCSSQFCLSCDRHIGSICLKCISGYTLKYYKCYDCGPQCQLCSSYGCNSCNDGYWGKRCDTKCAPNCVSCMKLDGYCLTCDFGHYLYTGKCTTCGIHCTMCGPRGCTSCHDGYWGSTCDENCAQNCASCRKLDGYCLSCNSGYYLYTGKCTTCGIHCAVCGSRGCTSCHDGYWGSTCDENCAQNCASCRKSDGYCLSCNSGYYINTGKCTTCATHCAVCGPRGCTSCHDGYWGSTCYENCAPNCASCRTSDGYCLSCASGYHVFNGKCTDCGTHCAACGPRRCTSCHDGYWGSTCNENCAQNCFSCRISDGYCLSCDSGHYLNKTLCYACGTHCSSCQLTGCQDCFNGRWGGACENSCVQRCNASKCEQSNGYCLSCVPGYWGNNCEHSCSHHCLSCNRISGECIFCKHGYWGHLCTSCGSHCKKCNQINGCSDVGNISEKQTTLTAALGGGLGGGIIALIVLAIIAMFWFRIRRRSNTERNSSLHDARKDYDTVDTNVREVELNDLRYEALQGTDVHTMDQTTDYSNVSEHVNDNITYQNVLGGSLSD